MSRPSTTHAKRQREQNRAERAQAKVTQRAERKKQKENRPSSANGEEDPDLAGIRPGPQPVQED